MQKYSDSELLDFVESNALPGEYVPSYKMLMRARGPSPHTIRIRFGSVNEAGELRGLRIREQPWQLHGRSRRYTREELLQEIRDVYEHDKRMPTSGRLKQRTGISRDTFSQVGRTTKDLMGAIGVDYRKELLESIRDIAEDGLVFSRQLSRNLHYPRRLYDDEFGSVEKAAELAGVEVLRSATSVWYDLADLLQALRERSIELGRPARHYDFFSVDGYPSYRTFYNRLGSLSGNRQGPGIWNNFLKMACINPEWKSVPDYISAWKGMAWTGREWAGRNDEEHYCGPAAALRLSG